MTDRTIFFWIALASVALIIGSRWAFEKNDDRGYALLGMGLGVFLLGFSVWEALGAL